MSQSVVPSQMTKMLYQQKIKAATRGWDLLKKKNDSLKKKLQDIMKLLIEKKKMVKKLFLKAYLSIAESEWSAGNFSQQIINQVNRASCTLDISFNNIAGVSLPTFIQREDDSFILEKIALTRGSAQIEKARNHFKELIDVLVDIASLQTSFVKLDQVIKVTSRRVNALEFIVIPKFKEIVDYIEEELEEQEREEKFTMKKVLENRKAEQARRDKEYEAKKKLMQGLSTQDESDNILASGDDEATLNAQKVDTIKSFLRNLVNTSLSNFEKKLAIEMREREQQNLQTKQNRKLFFGWFRHKKQKKSKKKIILPMESQMFSKTIIKGGKTKKQSEIEQLYNHMEEEFKIEVLIDQMVDEGWGEKLLWLLEKKLKRHKKHRYHKKLFPETQFDFSNVPIKKHHHHKKSHKISSQIQTDPLFEIYKDIPLDKEVLNVSNDKSNTIDTTKNDNSTNELDDFLNNYYLNSNPKGMKTFSSIKEVDPMKSVWGFKKKI